MKKNLMFVFALCLVIGFMGQVSSGARSDDPLGVAVSPHMLLLSADQGGTVTVHTSIPYSKVDGATVALNGLPARHTRADLRGELVADFNEGDVKAIVAPPATVLTLTGDYRAGGSFAGSDTVQVKP